MSFWDYIILSMLRLIWSLAEKCKKVWKPSKPCHVGIHRNTLTWYSQMSTHLPGIWLFFISLASFCVGFPFYCWIEIICNLPNRNIQVFSQWFSLSSILSHYLHQLFDQIRLFICVESVDAYYKKMSFCNLKYLIEIFSVFPG